MSLNIYLTDPHQMCMISRSMAVDERLEVSFSIRQGTVPWQPFLDQIQAPSIELGSLAIR